MKIRDLCNLHPSFAPVFPGMEEIMMLRRALIMALLGLAAAGCSDDVDESGACCLPDGICEQTGYDECANLGGGFKGVPSSCDADPCTSYCGSDANCGIGMYCHSSGECREGCKTNPDTCAEGACDPTDHTCKEPTYCVAMREQIQQYIDEKIDTAVIAYTGLIVGVDTPDCGMSILTTGLADLDPETPMRPEHILPIASISKMFVAVTVLQLVEEGRISLDDTLSNWRTDLPNADSITIRHLLTHRSGLPCYWETNCAQIHWNSPELVWSAQDLLDCVEGESPWFEPGAEFHYTNMNYLLLALIVEAITGNGFHEEIRSRILHPLGMSHTFNHWGEEVTGQISRSYYKDAGGSWVDVTDKYHFSFYWAAGDMVSNAEDLLVWIRALVSGSVLREDTTAEMLTCIEVGGSAIVFDEWILDSYGFGNVCGRHDNAGRTRGHSGGNEMAVSELHYSLDWNSSVVVLVNHSYSPNRDFQKPTVIDVFNILGEYR
ncbi:serine hydrolase domain-containing protein [Myxococcota bacterium]